MFSTIRQLALLATVSLIAACGGQEPVSLSSGSASTPPDNVAPSSPTALTGVAVGSTAARLSWAASTDNVTVADYVVTRNGAQIATAGATSYMDQGLAPATTYTYAVAAVDQAGNMSPNSTSVNVTTAPAGAPPDTTPPTQPANFQGVASGPATVNLSWTASTDNVGVTGYIVTRNGSQIATPAGTSLADAGLAASTTYAYTVVARDAAGNRSAAASASVTTAAASDATPPTQPTGFTAAAAGATAVNLSWTASTDNVGVTGYVVTRNGVQIATPTTTAFADSGLTGSTTYTYTVAARDAAGNKSTPASASVTTPSPATNGMASLAWDPGTAAVNLAGYRVYVGTSSGAYSQPLGQGLAAGTGTTFTVTGLTSGTRYFFAVTAFDTAGIESGFSNEVFKDIP